MKKLSASPKIREALGEMGISSFDDVLEHVPYKYEDFGYTPEKPFYEDKERIVLLGRLAGPVKLVRFSHRNCAKFPFLSDDGQLFNVEAWNRGYLHKSLKAGEKYTLAGSYDKKRRVLSLLNILTGEIEEKDRYRPVYRLPDAIPQRSFIALVKRAEKETSGPEDIIPESLIKKYRLLHKRDALLALHFPKSHEDTHQGMRTLKYEEALLFELESALLRQENKSRHKERKHEINYDEIRSFIKTLPYSLTLDQRVALKEIVGDMSSGHPMYRLLQGDVGTGKTLVAALSCFAAFTRGEQSAILAPTDSLARQHYENLVGLFSKSGLTVRLLVGSMKGEERRLTLEEIRNGEADIVVGTHAIFSKSVEYASLGLAVIDEQHKFGVNQRLALAEKGEGTDLLLMSATPIPRTLALTVFGDLDISTLTEFPSGVRNVETYLTSSKDPEPYQEVRAALERKERVYVVAPKIEENEGADGLSSVKRIYQIFNKRFPGRVALLHGSRSEEEKEAAYLSFKLGVSPVMVATSLVEVGLDVKEATTMLVFDPTRFSLSSLHQLRGRIGRGGQKARFYMLYDGPEEEKEKLEVLLNSNDGFEIAEADLRLRGPGEVAGTKQSGLPEFGFASVYDDFKVFETARNDSKEILGNIDSPDFAKIMEVARSHHKAPILA